MKQKCVKLRTKPAHMADATALRPVKISRGAQSPTCASNKEDDMSDR